MALLRSYLPFEEKQADLTLHLLALLAFAGSIYMGTHERGPIVSLPFVHLDVRLLSALLWIGLGLAALFLLRETVEDVWTEGVWLVACYVIAGLGAVMLTVGRRENFLWWVVGLLLVGLGLALMLNLWLIFYTKRRQLIQANPEVDPATFTLGYWNLLLPFFLLMTMATYYFWSMWYLEEAPFLFDHLSLDALDLYMLFDLAVFGMAIYALYLPQRSLGRYFIREVEPVEAGAFPGSGTLSRRLASQLTECQSCSAQTRLEQRSCPECHRATTFGWCPKCEHYSVICPSCGHPAVGGGSCSNCETDLGEYACPNCGNASALRRWSAS